MSDLSKVMSRIHKLLRLSRATSPEEAALAAQRAAELMAQHNLTEAQLSLTDESRRPEKIVNDAVVSVSKKLVAWKMNIAFAVARSFGCNAYNWRARWWNRRTKEFQVRLFGRESAVQAATYTTQCLWNEVERLCDEWWRQEGPEASAAGHSARVWKNSFRLGIASTIAIRLHEARPTKSQSPPPPMPAEHSPVTQAALVRVERDQEEVDSAYEVFSAKFTSGGSVGVVRSRNGYEAGREAGRTVRLGGSRAGLPAPPRKLPGGA